jgi:ATP/maltotriose-dependent transcriptional regulator MalT
MVASDVEFPAGDPAAAAALLEEGYEVIRRHSETGYLATIVGLRAQAAAQLGEDEDALRLANETERLASPDDFEPHARQRLVRAVVHARRGDLEAADEAIQTAEAIVEPTDCLPLKAFVAMRHAEVARLAGRAQEEREALEHALALSEAKGDLVTAAQARTRLAEFG